MLICTILLLSALTWSLNKSEAEVDPSFDTNIIAFLRKSSCCNANEFLFTSEKQ